MDEELQRGDPCRELIDDNRTWHLRSALHGLETGDDSAIREITENRLPQFLPRAKEIWDNHEDHKEWLVVLQKLLAATDPIRLKRMRAMPAEGLAEWVSSPVVGALIFQDFERKGLEKQIAMRLTLEPSVRAVFVSALATLAGYWFAFGGLQSTPAAVATNDLLDLEYVVLGAMSQGFCTQDKRAKIVYKSVSAALESRCRLLDSIRQLGPHWADCIADIAARRTQTGSGT